MRVRSLGPILIVRSSPGGQRAGQNINGDNVWDYVTYSGGEGFAADFYINTGYANWITGIDVCQ